ncbi:MAG TPA: RecX family transcriptional regulator [Oceanobacillus sp.]|nr:RecX family transcriptional regulator [Oceanobacillus sp.]
MAGRFLDGTGMSVITALEVQKRNKKRVNVYLDEEYAFSLSLDEAAKLRKGQTLSDNEVEQLRDQDAVAYAVDSAARFLAVRPRSIQEVRQNLLQKSHPPAVIDNALERLTALGYLDDRAFAEFWVRERNTFKPLSPRALRQELRQKGVADEIIDDVIGDLDADEVAYRAAMSQSRRFRGSDQRTFREKMYAFLQRRGFSYTTAKSVVRQLIEELSAEDGYFAQDSADDDPFDEE